MSPETSCQAHAGTESVAEIQTRISGSETGLGSELETESTGTVATTLTGTSEAESQTDLQDLRSGTPETPEIMGNYPEIQDKSPRVKYPEIQDKHPKIQEPESPAER